MRNYKVTWKLYSARRKITLESLVIQGKITGYESYVSYCENMSIEPISLHDFEMQTSQLFPKQDHECSTAITVTAVESIDFQPIVAAPAEVLDAPKSKKKLQKWEKNNLQDTVSTEETKKEDLND